MTITTGDQIIASAKQRFQFIKTGLQTMVANTPFSVFAVAGIPSAGTLAGTSEAAGVVPVAGDIGYPNLKTINSVGYLQQATITAANTMRVTLYDRLFVCGAYEFNDNVTLGSQPSFLSRIPGGNAAGCLNETELWVEGAVNTTGNLSVEVEYTNENGTTGRTTGAISYGTATIQNRLLRLPFQAGDGGVSQVNRVQGSVASVGADCFNVMVLRRLCDMRMPSNNNMDILTIARTAMKQIFDDTAFYPIVYSDATTLGTPDIEVFIMDG